METLDSWVCGKWQRGSGRPSSLVNPATEETLAETTTEGLDFAAAIDFARREGGPALRAMSFAARGELLLALSRAIHQHRDALLDVAMKNGGNTRGDAKFDVDGASGTLAAYAQLGKDLGDARFLVDGDGIQLGRSPRFFGHHVLVSRPGVAVHVNAFNFPAWGLAEKAACALLAGVPVITKPATSTALLAHRIVKLWDEAGVLPKGAFQLVCGSPGDLLTHLGGDDALAFTGSSKTATELRALPNVVARSVRVNVEADSLNSAILGPDVEVGSETWNMFVRDVVRDITQKTGQKCTAIRRVFAPRDRAREVEEAIAERLREIRYGDPCLDGVEMGPVATRAQHADVRAGLERLSREARAVIDAPRPPLESAPGKGFFVPPSLFVCDDPDKARDVHDLEVFGPAATLMSYDGSAAHASALAARGGGGLVCSAYTDDRAFTAELLFGLAPHHGRLAFGSDKIADQAPGPGTVLPQLIHGGPGRAGGGEELGGRRGLSLYMQRVAVQGSRPILEAILTRNSK